MNDYEKFENLYSKILENNNKKLEELRTNALKEFVFQMLIMLFPSTLIILALFSVNFIIDFYIEFFFFSSVLYPIGLLTLCIKVFNKLKKPKFMLYKNEFKSNIINIILREFLTDFEYKPNNGIDSSTYLEGEFDDNYQKYSSEDLIYGKLENNRNFIMGEILTEKHGHSRSGYPEDNYIMSFNGIFFKIETPKSFKAKFLLKEDNDELNILVKDIGKKEHQDIKVKLDSPEFEKIFDVYCTDEIIALQLLTPDIMELLMNFIRNEKIRYELTIKNNYIYIRIFAYKMFENPPLFKSSINKKTLYKYYSILKFILSLTSELSNLINETQYDDGSDINL